jgi:TetR/AcrR family transcriptional regulator
MRACCPAQVSVYLPQSPRRPCARICALLDQIPPPLRAVAMSDTPVDETPAEETPVAPAEAVPERLPTSLPIKRTRPRPGERRVQILQTLAQMLEQPGAERITTAALAAKLDVSEAALYRHFASKAQMFEGLIEFIETSVFSVINQLLEREPSPSLQAQKIATVLLQFGEKNPGMTRVMVGDALVFEHERLIARMNQFFDRVEAQLRGCLRQAAEAGGSPTPTVDAQVLASAIVSLVVGRLQRYARSGFKRLPTEHLEPALQRLTQ